MKRLTLTLGFAALALALASGYKVFLWIKVDPETQALSLSDGTPLPEGLAGFAIPGQFVEFKGQRVKIKKQWRPPLDLEKTYLPKETSRVVFSHERHFAALGAKATACETCHRTLDQNKTWKSLAPTPALEPHGPTSLGRFCATCHDGKTSIQQVAARIPQAKPPSQGTIFTTFGKAQSPSCQGCHAPKDHGQDFTPRHGELAEHGQARTCGTCHRGVDRLSGAEALQVERFRQAQLRLLQNPEDPTAAHLTLPNNFCAYCHGLDQKAWEED